MKSSVSIIIPCRNEVDFIDRCLSSVFKFDSVPGGFEVFVVDGMSDDGTRVILNEWSRKKSNLQVIDNPQKIVPTAMNIGIKQAKGKWIIRLDAHSIYPKDYLTLCLDTGKRFNTDNIGGVVITLPRNEILQSNLIQAITTHRFGVGNSEFRLNAKEGFVDTVPFGCYRREVFEKIGLFDERLIRNQDYEFNRRLVKSGGKIWCNPSIKATYFNQQNLIGLFKQAFNTGHWNPWMWYVAPYSFTLRHVIPALFVLSVLSTIVITIFSSWGWLSLLFILSAYFLLALKAALDQSRRFGWWLFPVLPFLFFVYHFSYGIGILKGLLALIFGVSPVQRIKEPWPGAGRYRAWPPKAKKC